MKSGSLAVLGLLLAQALPASAQPDATVDARAEFERGYALAQQGELEAAIVAFERAYQARPNYAVLYNLALAYADSGRVVAAVDTFGRYLSLGGDAIPVERRREVEASISYHSRRIGEIELDVLPSGASIFLDGHRIGTAPLGSRLRASAGNHTVTAELAGHASAASHVVIVGGRSQRLVVRLRPAANVDARVIVTCPVPGVALSVDGRGVELPPPGEPLELPSGSHRFVFRRVGYREHVVIATVTNTRPQQLACALAIDPKHPDNAELRVRHPAGTRTFLDGSPFSGGAVPPGMHVLSVSGTGFHESRSLIVLSSRERRTLTIDAPRTSSARADEEARSRSIRHTVAYVAGGTALAAGAAAVALYVDANRAHGDWRSKSRELVGRLRTDPDSVSPSQLDELLQEENSIRNRDTLAVGLSVFSGVLLASAAFLRLWEPVSAPALTTSGRDLRMKVHF